MSDLATMEDAFRAGQARRPHNLLYSSPMWFAYMAGRASVHRLGGHYPVLKVKMARGYSLRVRLTTGEFIFHFGGADLTLGKIEVGA